MTTKSQLMDGVAHIPLDKLSYTANDHGDEVIVTVVDVEWVAREIAGQFFDKNRSPKFRMLWGTSDKQQNFYVDQNWRSFIEPARQAMAAMLADPAIPDENKQEIYAALCQDRNVELMNKGGASGIIQVEPDSEQYEGSKWLHKDAEVTQ